MRYVFIDLSILLAGVLGACSSSAANDIGAASSNLTTPPIVATELPSASTETECKICSFDFASYKGELSREEVEGLLLALNDEYLAMATYEKVNKDHSDPRPFVNIVLAEKRHAEMLKELFNKYAVKIPENPWPGVVPKFDTVVAACEAGVKDEIANRDLYTKLLKSTSRQDIIETYRYLQGASEKNHLPAFERCDGYGGNGRRRGGKK
jgi:hypothetical protein